MEFCGQGERKALVGGKIEDGVLIASTYELKE
jgi:hypothetical protein